MYLPGSTAYLFSLVSERVLSLVLVKFLIQDISPEAFGLWAQAVSLSGLLHVLLMFRLDNAQIVVYADIPVKYRKAAFLFPFCIIFVFTVVVFLFVTFFANGIASLVFGGEKQTPLLLPIILFSASEAMSAMAHAFLRSTQRQSFLALFYFLRFAGRSLLLILMLGPLGMSLEASVTVLACYGVFICCIGFLPEGLHLPQRNIVSSKWLSLKKEASSQLSIAVIYWALSNIDKYFILYFSNISEVASFAFLLGVSAPIGIIYSVFQQALLPALAKANKIHAERFDKLSSEFFSVNLFLGIGAVSGLTALSPLLLSLIGSNQFNIGRLEFFLVGILMLLSNLEQLLGSLLSAKQQSQKHLRSATVCVIVLFVLLALLSPKFGILGVLSARIFSSLMVITMLEKKIGQRLIRTTNLKRLTYWVFSSVIMYFVVINGPPKLILEMSWGCALLSILSGALVYCFLNINYVSRVVLPFLFRNYAA